eukprot:jgi/Picsp_1/4492/NSC_06713-R1_malonyl :acp acyltransferase
MTRRMGRDMTATGRYPPVPKYPPIAFYSAVRLGDPEQLAKVMDADPYFITQDNGAGAPVHFATTYKQLDMLHHLLNNGAEINQRDEKGFTPLHRAAYLAHYDGYMEIYEYLLSRGADPSLLTEDYDPYLNPGRKTPIEVAPEDEEIKSALKNLEKKYAKVPKVREPHSMIGDWWTIYDYGLDELKSWKVDHSPTFPEDAKREKDAMERKAAKDRRKKARAEAIASGGALPIRKSAPKGPVAFLFPGQGSQAVGMLNESKDLPAVKKMLETANKVLGYDLLKLCNEGPKEDLDNTIYSQPALFVAGLAAVEKIRTENPSLVDSVAATAGLSLGEYTALVFSGAISFEDGISVVKVRAESMAEAAKMGDPHGMLSVVGLGDSDLEVICKEVREKMPGKVCQVANFLFPQGRVVSGHKAALEEVQKLATKKGALKAVPVAVSGAFHTSLMSPARDALVSALEKITISDPLVPVYSNVTGEPFKDAREIRDLLPRQLVEPVKWEPTLKAIIASGKNELHELGPGAQIKAMVKRLDNAVWKNFKNIAA